VCSFPRHTLELSAPVECSFATQHLSVVAPSSPHTLLQLAAFQQQLMECLACPVKCLM
jgi:hypothetical protein